MELPDRIEVYREIEAYRDRPLIVYATSTRQGVNALMAGDAVREFIDQIDAIPNGTEVDVLIHSTGGDALAAWKLMSVMRERFDVVGVLVPNLAFSAATIFALGANEIVMHPHASLGPIDPQILIPSPDGNHRRFSFEDVGAFLRFLTGEVGLTEQAFTSPILRRLFAVVDPVLIGGAMRASELATDVGERLLQMHMTGPEENGRAREIASRLNKTFFAHGDAVSRTRARELDLKIAADDDELERLVWKAYCGLEDFLLFRSPFDPLRHYLSNGGREAVAPASSLNLPSDTPPNVAQQIWHNVMQQAMGQMSRAGVEVPYRFVNAVVESSRCASQFRTAGYLSGSRTPEGEIRLAATDTESGWRPVPLDERDDGSKWRESGGPDSIDAKQTDEAG